MKPNPPRSSALARNLAAPGLLAGALGLFAAASCGDGMDVQLGTKGELPAPQLDGGGSADSSGESDTAAADAPDVTSACANGEAIPALMLGLLEADGDLTSRARVGFGRDATGGKGGCLYRVTDLADELRPGTLRFALESPGPVWIIFDQNGVIELKDNLRPLSNKTIDGRNTSIILKNYGIEIAGQQNFVIENVEFIGDLDADASADAGDAISLRQASHTVWIDHCTFSGYADGLIDVTEGATDVTISWSHFLDQEKVMLLGSENDEAVGGAMRVTLHHNWFDHTYTFQPRIRWGMVHTFNNLLDAWGDYGVAASQLSRLYSELNVYLADETVGSTEAILTQIGDEDPGKVWSEQDSFLGGAEPHLNVGTPDQVFVPKNFYLYSPSPIADVQNAVRNGAGAHP